MSRPAVWVPRQQGRRTQAIINTNLKTELCRNWQNGACTYGDRCAFAHGMNELKYRTLREMQNAGRIPDAAKYRCFPCMTWVATGSCPYSTRCVFIHDPRVEGPLEAWLYAGSHPSSAYHSSDSSFFFPDLPRDPDSLDLPRDPSLYDLDPNMAASEDSADRAVYHMWYCFVAMLTQAATDTSAANEKTKNPPPAPNDAGREDAINVTAKAGTTTSYRSGDIETRVAMPDRACAVDDCTAPRSSNNVLQGSANGGDVGTSTTSRLLVEDKQQPVQEVNRRIEGIVRLPVLVHLGMGVPATPSTPPSPTVPLIGFSIDGAPPPSHRRHLSPRWGRTKQTSTTSRMDGGYSRTSHDADTGVRFAPRAERPLPPISGVSDYVESPYHRHHHYSTSAMVATTGTRPPPATFVDPSARGGHQSVRVSHPAAKVEMDQSFGGGGGAHVRGGAEADRRGYAVAPYARVPAFPGYSRVGTLMDPSLSEGRPVCTVASF